MSACESDSNHYLISLNCTSDKTRKKRLSTKTYHSLITADQEQTDEAGWLVSFHMILCRWQKTDESRRYLVKGKHSLRVFPETTLAPRCIPELNSRPTPGSTGEVTTALGTFRAQTHDCGAVISLSGTRVWILFP